MSWDESLKFGQEVERYVLARIQKTYPKAYIQDGFYKEWDIYVPELRKGIEVKCDMRSNISKAFLVEVTMGDKPSALTTTKAEIWVFFNGFSLYWIKPMELMKAILIAGLSVAKFTGGTDTIHKTAYFVPIDLLEEHCLSITYPLNDVPDKIQYDPEKQK